MGSLIADSAYYESLMREKFGEFNEEGEYIGREVIEYDLSQEELDKAIDNSLVIIKEGDIVKGTVVAIDRDEVLVDVGYKSEGIIPLKELSLRSGVAPYEIVSIGDKIEAVVLTREDKQGRLILSKKRAQYERAWVDIEKIKALNGTVSGPVIEIVKGGLIVDIGLRGFLPASLVDVKKIKDLDRYLGQMIEAKIIELDRSRNNVVLSRRKWLEEAQAERRAEFIAQLHPGEIREGVVSSLVNFGAFVDLGGIDGLVHVSEISWHHINHPSEALNVGDRVQVKIVEVDLENSRISLSIKATQPDPWKAFADDHNVGELVYGRITKLTNFGAFIQIGDGIEGLAHISELAPNRITHPDQAVQVGEELWVKIIEIDPARRRIYLSVKRAAEGGEVAAEYRDAFGEYGAEGDNFDEPFVFADADADFTPESEAQAAWAEYLQEQRQEAQDRKSES